jgi:hypothetical protein
VQRDQALAALAELTRHLDGMAGGVQALDSILATENMPANVHTGPLV